MVEPRTLHMPGKHSITLSHTPNPPTILGFLKQIQSDLEGPAWWKLNFGQFWCFPFCCTQVGPKTHRQLRKSL